jgi:peroxisomal 2,4-dienoyl-CoA reductase
LVTGGATGIGEQIAHTLAAHGAAVFICGRKLDRLQSAAEKMQQQNYRCEYAACDVREPEQVEAMLDQLLAAFGRLDIVVNNAAGNFPAPIDKISYNGFKTIVDIDLLGTYNVSKAAFSKYLKQHGGNIVNISAPFQHGGAAWQAHVGAAKAGVDSLTRTCAVEMGEYGIRVNAVAPGAISSTEGMARFTSAQEDLPVANPLGVVGDKADIANAVLFFVSDAARYINGQLIAVDGGAAVDLLKVGKQVAQL